MTQDGEPVHCVACGRTFPAMTAGAVLCADCVTRAGPAGPAGQAAPGGGREEWREGEVVAGLYEVREVIRTGGMGLVYRVWHRGWDRELAVKSPRRESLAQAGGVRPFEREAGLWMDLGLHPHIVSCYYVRVIDQIPRVFAEFVAGGSLEEWISDQRLYAGGPGRALARMLDVAIQFAWGLGYAHEQGLVHRDVKPANVLLTADGVAKVTDFGLAGARPGGTATAAEAGALGRTEEYCSPEQSERAALACQGVDPTHWPALDQATDVWSWAVSVLAMFCGGAVWGSGLAAPLMLETLAGEDPPPGLPAIPPGLAPILGECLQADPGCRPGMTAVAGRLTSVYAKHTGHTFGRPHPAPARLLAASLSNRGASLLDLGREDEAMLALAQAVQADPGDCDAVYNRAMLGWSRGELTDEEAAALVRGRAEAAPGRWQGWLDLARTSLRRRDLPGCQQALSAARQAGAPQAELAGLTAQAGAVRGLGACRELSGCTSRVMQVEFADDGTVLAVCQDQSARQWDPASGSELPGCRPPPGAAYLRQAGVFTAPLIDGSYVIWRPGSRGKDQVRVFRGMLRANLRKNLMTVGDLPLRVVFSDPLEISKSMVIFAAADGQVSWWDLLERRAAGSIRVEEAGVPPALAASGDGRRVAVATGHGDVYVWDLWARRGEPGTAPAQPVLARHFPADTFGAVNPRMAGQTVRRIALAADGSRLAVTVNDLAIGIWDADSGQARRTLKGHGSPALALLMLPGSRYLASGGADAMVRIWDLADGTCIRTLGPHRGRVRTLAASPDGSLLAAGTHEGEVRLWDISGAGPLPPARMAISSVATAEAAVTAQSQADRLLAECDRLLASGDWLAAAACVEQARRIPGFERHPGPLARWRRLGERLEPAALRDAWRDRAIAAHPEQVHALAVSPQGTLAASGGADGALNLWELATGDRVAAVAGAHGGGNVVCLAYDRVSGTLASGGADGHVRLWDGSSLAPLAAWPVHRAGIHGVRFAPDGSALAVAAVKGVVAVYDPAGNRRAIRAGVGRALYSADYSPDGQLIAVAAGDGRCHLLDAATLKTVRTLRGHTGCVFCAVFAPRSGQVLSAGQDRTLRLWDARTGRCQQVLEGHGDMVLECRFTRDGQHAASVSWDGTLRLWELGCPAPVRTFAAHAGQVQAMDISPDSYYVVSGGWDGAVGVWLLDWALRTS